MYVLTDSDRKTLLRVARESIEAQLERREAIYPPSNASLQEKAGAFVTLQMKDRDPSLRGCIGQIDARAGIYDVVKSVAHSAAFSDYRFRPVTLAEWPSIEIEISVLSPLKLISSLDEINVGRHGLYMTRGPRSGLLLPQVAGDRAWDRTTFLEQTCRKAGLHADAYKEEQTSIYTFSADVFDERTLLS